LSVAAPKNTLAYQLKGRPLTLKRDLSGVPITGVSSTIRQFAQEFPDHAQPEGEAIMFYLANHAMKELAFRFDPLEPLPDWALHIADEYHRVSAKIAARAFYYLILITAREARHNSQKNTSEWKVKIKNQFGAGPMMALLHYPDDNDIEEVTGVFDQYAPDATLGDICRSITFTHYEGSFSGGYGGPKWGNVSDCMTQFATGQSTAEVMLDTVWTLVHNGGPIFNKGMLYHYYNGNALQQVLDIQRAGQIPRMVLAPYGKHVAAENYVQTGAIQFAKMVVEHLGETADFRAEPVDFKEVQALGAVGSYTHLIQTLTQTAAPPKPVYGAAKPATAPVSEVSEKTHYIIAKKPGMMFKKLTRKEVKAHA
jgi:hypothetical protein